MVYMGLISGTSMDGIDAALVDFDDKQPKLIGTLHSPYPKQLQNDLLNIISTDPAISQVAKADHQVGLAFADSATKLLKKFNLQKTQCLAIGSHGQNIYHEPDSDFPTTIQIGDPNIIAEKTGITTVADFRRRDMAAGGQGAPLAPAFHEQVFREENADKVILNIGGISNVTFLSGDRDKQTTGFDCGPGNALMDSWIYKNENKTFDKNGDWAASGKINEELLKEFLNDPYFLKQPPKSTGREHFNLEWLEVILKNHAALNAVDVQATLCELTAQICAKDIFGRGPNTKEVLVCGGGAHNQYLMVRLANVLSKNLSDCKLDTTAAYGIEPDWVEAMAFAWMAKQTMEDSPANLPGVTGANHPVILGGIYKAD